MTAADDRVNILLVDDQPANLLALESILADMGQNLVKAESGRAALKALLDHEFAVILLDVQMPDLNGFETASLIRERDKSRHHRPPEGLLPEAQDEPYRATRHGIEGNDPRPFEVELVRRVARWL